MRQDVDLEQVKDIGSDKVVDMEFSSSTLKTMQWWMSSQWSC